jgi:thiamine-phosphate pyrophosphorylase
LTLPPLYCIADADIARAAGWTVPALARAFLAGGARLLQVRAKSAGSAELLALCDEVAADARAAGATVIVNDRADVARLSGAAGVHVGQDDLRPAAARAAAGEGLLVVLSTHNQRQVDEALGEPIDYLAVGPVFGTTSKAAADPAVGLDLVRHAATARGAAPASSVGRLRPAPSPLGSGSSRIRVPVVAIGGITLERAPEVIAAGASSVAVISDLLAGGDPERRVREYLARLAGPPGPP